ncbi:uncharacterized protein PV09_05463 [Verruconis gallopava]|uniref:Uncharacterized protein n=1 Tax=Verruconis gallopava TaxID=253628 RepID=A0A0D1YRJ0_9PEZI|nr:uncharacterized protein PV09_05463 [Verruconis gallopava]KIW03242.1 hypothetical protein PV09_05463 [Verruconis gallopava]
METSYGRSHSAERPILYHHNEQISSGSEMGPFQCCGLENSQLLSIHSPCRTPLHNTIYVDLAIQRCSEDLIRDAEISNLSNPRFYHLTSQGPLSTFLKTIPRCSRARFGRRSEMSTFVVY